MKGKATFLKTVIETSTDINTGEEVNRIKSEASYFNREPDFVKLYIDDIANLTDLPRSGSAVLLLVIRLMNYQNEVTLLSYQKDSICEALGLKMDTVNKAVQCFVNQGILIRKFRGIFLCNPNLFGRGKWQDVNQLRLEIKYNNQGRTVSFDRENKADE